MLPGMILDRFDFQTVNQEVAKCVRVTTPGASGFNKGQVVLKDLFDETNLKVETEGGTPAKSAKPRMAKYETQLLGITKASVQSSSFISAASFQETTKVLTEAALQGKVDNLVGLKENVILGHLIPAGTGFRTFQESDVQYNLEAMQAAAAAPTQTLEESFPLLDSGESTSAAPAGGGGIGADAGASVGADGLASLLAGGSPAPATVDGKDDLTRIEGIGPKVAEALAAVGIDNFVTLSITHPDRIKEILAGAGAQFAVHDPTTWPDQSQLAAAGEWDKLAEWQAVLDGGKEVGGASTAPAAVADAGGVSEAAAVVEAAPAVPTEAAAPVEAAVPAPEPVAEPAPQVASEDLTKIEGIGPKIAEVLNANGITTYAQLAASSPDQIRQMLEAAEGNFANHDPSTWPDQAQLAASGEWDKLKEWQDELDGGKPAAKPDDLTIVEGIGPKIAELLNESGIHSFSDLAASDAEKIKEILVAQGGLMATRNPTTWPQQAQMAADGQWDELKKWQDELDGGV